jgi:hypothetical protein
VANSSGINGLSQCEFAEIETAKEKVLVDKQECQAIIPNDEEENGTSLCIPFLDADENPIEIEEDTGGEATTPPDVNTTVGTTPEGYKIWCCGDGNYVTSSSSQENPCGPLESSKEECRPGID